MELTMRIVILLFVLAAIVLAILLWLNPDLPSSATQIATLLGAVALASTAVSPIFKQEKKQSFYTLTLFRDNALGGFMTGPAYHPYWDSLGHLFNGLDSRSSAFGSAMLVEKAQTPDFLQYAIMKQLILTLKGHWDGETVRLGGVYGGNPAGKLIMGTDSPFDTLKGTTVRAALGTNPFGHLIPDEDIQVPKGTTLVAKTIGDDRLIELNTNGFKITMGVVGWSTKTLTTPVWGIVDPPVKEPLRYELQQYTIVIMAETPKFRRYLAGVDSYWKWFENIKDAFVDIDWKTIDAAMIDQSRRGDYPDVLGQNIQRYRAAQESSGVE
ncbi:hypothetical protein BR1R5_21370 [Pseudomonas sp. BR1R-5]|nr:hypothetical protein BR1R5_21370 [Pseudomonas sp. BR1R-5]